MEEKCLMIEDKCLFGDISCISGKIGEKCKNGGAGICSTFNEYMGRALFGDELYDMGRSLIELMKNHEYNLEHSLALYYEIKSKQKRNLNMKEQN